MNNGWALCSSTLSKYFVLWTRETGIESNSESGSDRESESDSDSESE